MDSSPMHNKRRITFTGVLVMATVLFGMVLAGGIHLAPVSMADDQDGQDVRASGYRAEADLEGRGVTLTTPTVGGLPSFADLAEAVSPAVVTVQAVKIENAGEGRGRDPFEFFFPRRRPSPQQPQEPQEPQERRSDAAGSGFVISSDGLVVTNHHVIEDASELRVLLGGRQYVAEVKGDDPATDIALLKIQPERKLTYLNLGDSDGLRVGDWVMVIGSPLQLQNSVSVGVVSAKQRSINITPDFSLESFIQTDAAINFGNSGGPLVDLQGQVVGIATAINFGAENIGFAVPSSTLMRILPQLRDTGSVRRGYLGVEIADLTYEDAQAWGLDSTAGVLVQRVTPDGPAAAAGLKHGDVILQVGDHQVEQNRDLIDYVSALPPGTGVKVKLFRDGKVLDREIELGERPSAVAAEIRRQPEEESAIEWLGLQYQDLTPGLRASHGIPEDQQGVFVVQVAPSSPLFEETMRPGHVIVEVNGKAVAGVEEFESAVEAAPSGSFMRLYAQSFNPERAYFAVVRVP
ncbi:MAG TPA: trypsin-like peptidase domain-containing protein [Thermoanaerobaculia bacterium]